jgi:hypothetical protein
MRRRWVPIFDPTPTPVNARKIGGVLQALPLWKETVPSATAEIEPCVSAFTAVRNASAEVCSDDAYPLTTSLPFVTAAV